MPILISYDNIVSAQRLLSLIHVDFWLEGGELPLYQMYSGMKVIVGIGTLVE